MPQLPATFLRPEFLALEALPWYVDGVCSVGERVSSCLERAFRREGVAYDEERVAARLFAFAAALDRSLIPGGVDVIAGAQWEVPSRPIGGSTVPAGAWGRFWVLFRALEEHLHLSGEFVHDGHMGQSPNSIMQLLRIALLQKDVKTVCEVGFNAGSSALAFLAVRSDIKVLSFDLGEHEYGRQAAALFQKWFPGRFQLVEGYSVHTIPEVLGSDASSPSPLSSSSPCDVIIVDGGHRFEDALADFVHFADVVYLQHEARKTVHNNPSPQPVLLIADDLIGESPRFVGVPRAWFRAVEAGLITENWRVQSMRWYCGQGVLACLRTFHASPFFSSAHIWPSFSFHSSQYSATFESMDVPTTFTLNNSMLFQDPSIIDVSDGSTGPTVSAGFLGIATFLRPPPPPSRRLHQAISTFNSILPPSVPPISLHATPEEARRRFSELNTTPLLKEALLHAHEHSIDHLISLLRISTPYHFQNP